jgi:hypothetical protein
MNNARRRFGGRRRNRTEETMQDKQYPAVHRDEEEKLPSAREIRDLPAFDRSHAADRPNIFSSHSPESGLLRELAESPGHLD